MEFLSVRSIPTLPLISSTTTFVVQYIHHRVLRVCDIGAMSFLNVMEFRYPATKSPESTQRRQCVTDEYALLTTIVMALVIFIGVPMWRAASQCMAFKVHMDKLGVVEPGKHPRSKHHRGSGRHCK